MENGVKVYITAKDIINLLMEVHMMENGLKAYITVEGS